jgi:transposase
MLIASHVQVYIARERADLRKSYQGLGLLVQDKLGLDALSGHLFVFFNKRLDKVKILYWDVNGFCLWNKRLERGCFKVGAFKAAYWQLSLQQLMMLIAGFDIKGVTRKVVNNQYVMT